MLLTRRGETADSYLRRLAAANHLPLQLTPPLPRQARGQLRPHRPRQAPRSRRPRAPRDPAHPGRPGPAPRPPARRFTADDIKPSRKAKREKYAAIRRDDGNGMSGRAIQRKHHVGRRTIIKALASAEPPERKKIHREPAALNGMHGHIDAMIETDPNVATAATWHRLADHHSTTVAYYPPRLRRQPPRRRQGSSWQATSRRAESMTKPVPETPPGQLR